MNRKCQWVFVNRRTWTWTSERLGWLEFQKETPAWNSISAWAIKGTPFQIWISAWAIKTWIWAWAIKVTPFLNLDFGLGYLGDALPNLDFGLGY
ncbi:unnamed protein product [Rhizophagus irregularis]|nr:unnamed protein product [Rhizophagus irregularis]